MFLSLARMSSSLVHEPECFCATPTRNKKKNRKKTCSTSVAAESLLFTHQLVIINRFCGAFIKFSRHRFGVHAKAIGKARPRDKQLMPVISVKTRHGTGGIFIWVRRRRLSEFQPHAARILGCRGHTRIDTYTADSGFYAQIMGIKFPIDSFDASPKRWAVAAKVLPYVVRCFFPVTISSSQCCFYLLPSCSPSNVVDRIC